ncbi:MAG: type II toxin-antitoxin system VapC family toxin [Pseudomonadota bacterium]
MTDLLLDTPTLLWWLFDDPRLSGIARQSIAAPEHRIWVSAASAWEIATKARIGKLPEAGDVPQKLPHYLRHARFLGMPINIEHSLRAGALPGPHRDPFDRMLIAQALATEFPFVTADPVFHDYGVKVVW